MEFSFFLYALILLLLSNIHKPISATKTLVQDRNTLLAFKNVVTFDPFGVLSRTWSSNSSVCYWVGVSCGIRHRRVTSLNVSGFGLRGTLPPHLGNLTFLGYLDISSNNFTGIIPYEISRLRRLREINMEINSFTGEIPSWFGALPQLEILGLGNNTFSGRIPPSLFNNSNTCKKLRILDMSYNSLHGSIPEDIGNCSSLQMLFLDSNVLTGSIPRGIFNISSMEIISTMSNNIQGSLQSADMCSNLPNLKWLRLSANHFEGRIPPDIWKCRELERLSLSANSFNGEIPSEIGSLSMLKVLYLGYNDFKGGVPAELGNLSQLQIFDISSASFTGSIPKEIGNCTSMQELYLESNYLTGELPQELAKLTFLEFLSIANNSLSGSIPLPIFNMSNLKSLQLSFNEFSGSLHIPSDFSHSNLEGLYLAKVGLSGEIPSSIANASKLTALQLSNNSFSGLIPNFGNLRLLQKLVLSNNNLTANQELEFLSSLSTCRYLEVLWISENPLNGNLPTSIGNLSSLNSLRARACNITGVIPSTIGNWSNMQNLYLDRNKLTGLVPPTIGNLKQLQMLSLYDNRLQGNIPRDICRLGRIGDLYLSDNLLTGPIPECFGDLTTLRNVYLGSNMLSSNIPSHFWNLRDLLFLNLSSNYLSGQLSSQIASLKVINLLDMSHNQFSGDIPSSIEDCQSLGFLSLSNNRLGGSIPTSLGKIKGLNTIDLSNNNLSGPIPRSLEDLKLLRYFNVSYNELEGEIPTGGPFFNFTPQSFFNNSALCGATKFQVPRCAVKSIRKARVKELGGLMKYILPPFILVIALATIIVLVLVRRRRLKRVQTQTPTDISLGATWRRISYIELARGTNAFSETNLLGRGSFGAVFKATLSDGLNVAVKVFNLPLERAIRSFDTECEILSNIRHRNLVRIIGCCSNTEFKSLVLGYMPNGSLEKWLHSENYCLNLMQRLQIAIDVALALEYLHHGHTFPVVHCDIKPSNVLLDEDMVAHLADFGMSKLFENGEAMVQTKTLATIGYAAPEYGSEGKVSTNGDVYSYGILLLEMFTGKKPTDDMFNDEMSLREFVNRALQENAASDVVSPDLLTREGDRQHSSATDECVSAILSLAMKCLALSPGERINMIETVAILQKIKVKVSKLAKRLSMV